MLRKVIHIVLAVFLWVATTGVTFSMHYCRGKLVSTAINKEAKSCCDGSGGCCQTKTVHYEVKNNFVSPVITVANGVLQVQDILFPIYNTFSFGVPEQSGELILVVNDASPPSVHSRLALLQTYLI